MKLTFSPDEAAQSAGVGKSTIHDAIRNGHLRSFKIGRLRKIKASDLQAWCDWLAKQSDAGSPVTYRPSPHAAGGAA